MRKGHKVSFGFYSGDISFDNSKDALLFYDLLNKGTIVRSEYLDGKSYTHENGPIVPVISPCEILSDKEWDAVQERSKEEYQESLQEMKDVAEETSESEQEPM